VCNGGCRLCVMGVAFLCNGGCRLCVRGGNRSVIPLAIGKSELFPLFPFGKSYLENPFWQLEKVAFQTFFSQFGVESLRRVLFCLFVHH
jgi:hypothetical protein